ncbi:alcohol dehydrogenase catalytic domain-containing protein [Leptolyngbya sp. 7M]|uniref:alcohol dehydrogenase catalytic domain-containing protein n=1 Tax=Leptolyngbya sp. 7M TaxID=2812896 RepID=UPI001B8CB26C|nr:alcohol dehydrogenase catalytic domain-containing protein [Leptolyngbya sp. 7M]QYO63258.1 alcohol dehydrogenase catalytic domain-containing protein [Leptolyngbya sp. 7M]
MKAVCWHGAMDMRVETVPDPKLLNSRDAIVKITSTAICGSDIHIYDGFIPTMKPGDIVGHEFMGEVVEVGRDVKRLKVGDRVVVPFPISCGQCFFCKSDLWSLCDNSNPNAWMAEKLYGHSPAALFGYSHLFGGAVLRPRGIWQNLMATRCGFGEAVAVAGDWVLVSGVDSSTSPHLFKRHSSTGQWQYEVTLSVDPNQVNRSGRDELARRLGLAAPLAVGSIGLSHRVAVVGHPWLAENEPTSDRAGAFSVFDLQNSD